MRGTKDIAPRRAVRATDFCLEAAGGGVLCLRDFLEEGPVILWFFRGHECQRCRRALAQVREEYESLLERGTRVVAISPDTVSDSARLARELGLPFPLLSDPERRVAAGFDIAVPGDLLPSAFVVDRRGRVQWSHIGRDPADLPRLKGLVRFLSGGGRLAVPAASDIITPIVAALAAATLALLGVLAAVANQDLLPFDEPIRDAIRSVDAAWFGELMHWTTRLGSRWLIVVLTVPMAAFAWRRCRQFALVLVAAVPSALLLEMLLKTVVDRPRPPLAIGFGSSFPSGHVIAAAAFWGLVPPWVYLVTRKRSAWATSAVMAGAIVVCVGVSRVYLGAHWPSDVIGGYLGGVVFLLAAEWAVRRAWQSLRCDACDLHPLRSAAHFEELR